MEMWEIESFSFEEYGWDSGAETAKLETRDYIYILESDFFLENIKEDKI